MKRFALSLSIMLISLSLVAKDVESKITSVVVYPSGATVERKASTSLKAGANTLRFLGISNTINQKSIQLEAQGDYIIQSISYRYEYLEPLIPNPAIRMLQDSVQWLTDKRGEHQAIKYAYDVELKFLNNNSNLQVRQDQTQSSELEKIADILRNRILEIKLKLHTLSLKDRKLNETIQRINLQVNELRGFSPERTGIVEIKLIAEKPIKGDFKLSYLVANAGWRPSYDLKFTEINEPIQLKYNAWVQQSTGIDWKNARLTLSTSTPKLSNSLPVLHPWQLFYKEPVQYSYKNQAVLESYSYTESKNGVRFKEDDSEKPALTAGDFTAMMETMVSMDFEIDLPYTIESDGKENLINLRKEKIDAEFNYYAAPKIENEAFLVANITDWYKLNLLPGPGNMFIGNTFMGQSYINPGIANDTLKLGFGRDKMVQIERKLLNRVCKKGFVAGKQKHELDYEIAIRNLHKDAINITIEDQIPISSIEEIEVELQSKSGAEYNEKTGSLTWDLKLESGKADKKTFSFTVKHPRSKVVYPLNNVN